MGAKRPVVVFYHSQTGSEYWFRLGLEDMQEAMKRTVNTGTAKNVILFLGDGKRDQGPATGAVRGDALRLKGRFSWHCFHIAIDFTQFRFIVCFLKC